MRLSLRATLVNRLAMSSTEGAAMRMPRQRDRKGSMSFDAELHSRMILHCEEYLSERNR